MNRTIYQIWRFNPDRQAWFHYNHIPSQTDPAECLYLLAEHRAGRFRGNQFKSWMRDSEFKLVRVDQEFTDIKFIR